MCEWWKELVWYSICDESNDANSSPLLNRLCLSTVAMQEEYLLKSLRFEKKKQFNVRGLVMIAQKNQHQASCHIYHLASPYNLLDFHQDRHQFP